MTYARGALRALAVTGGLLVFGSCASGESERNIAATVDTLPNGALHVTSAPAGTWATYGGEPWRLVEELRIGAVDGTGPDVFGSVRNVIPDPMGRVWAMESQAFELRQFDADGGFVRAVGREGDGPGEFGSNPCAFAGPDGEVWVESAGRWQRFDTAGVLLGRQPSRSNLGCGIRRWLPDGRFLAVNADYDPATRDFWGYFVAYHMDDSGDLVAGDTIPYPTVPDHPRIHWLDSGGNRRVTMPVPLVHRGHWTLGPRGDFWITEGGGDYRVRRESLTGDTLLIMERPYEPVPVPDSVRAREIDGLQREGLTIEGGFDTEEIPRVYPPFDRYFIATDGTLWVRRHLEGGTYGLDVFAADGSFLGPVESPPEFDRMDIQHVTPDDMYGTVRDDLGLEYVVRLGIRKGEG